MVKGEKENKEKQRGRKKKNACTIYIHHSLTFTSVAEISLEMRRKHSKHFGLQTNTNQRRNREKKNVEKNVPCVSCSALQMANEKKNVPVLSLIVKLSVALLHDEVNLAVMQF